MKIEPWQNSRIKVPTRSGEVEVLALVHPRVPYLALTSMQVGRVDVTHVPTGRRLFGPYQRWGNAALKAVQATLCFDLVASTPEGVQEALGSVGDLPVPFDGATMTSGEGIRPLTRREWFEGARNWIYQDEFPWEGGKAPESVAADLMARSARPPSGDTEAAPAADERSE